MPCRKPLKAGAGCAATSYIIGAGRIGSRGRPSMRGGHGIPDAFEPVALVGGSPSSSSRSRLSRPRPISCGRRLPPRSSAWCCGSLRISASSRKGSASSCWRRPRSASGTSSSAPAQENGRAQAQSARGAIYRPAGERRRSLQERARPGRARRHTLAGRDGRRLGCGARESVEIPRRRRHPPQGSPPRASLMRGPPDRPCVRRLFHRGLGFPRDTSGKRASLMKG